MRTKFDVSRDGAVVMVLRFKFDGLHRIATLTVEDARLLAASLMRVVRDHDAEEQEKAQ